LSLGVDAYLDRATPFSATSSPWATRWLLRAVHTLPTGTPIMPGSSGLFRSAPVRAVATVKGIVFTDWNGNGLQDPGEGAVSGVPLRLEAVGAAESSKNGEFIFKNVPDGLHEVGLDVGSLPIDFDAPAISRLQVALSGHDTRQVAFGLIPLGSIRGRIVRDVNNNGVADTDEPIVENAVVVLDGGKRSEQARRGRYAFEAVQSGEHTVTLLAESLPEGALVAGEATQIATLGRDRMTLDIPFAVSLETRAEIRKAFPAASARVPTRAAPPRREARPTPPPVLPEPAPARSTATFPEPTAAAGAYTLQIAAFDDPIRAREMVAELKRKDLAAYLVAPPAGNPHAPYRVRVGAYATRLDAERAGSSVSRIAGIKVWVTKY
jgi:cell division septation protein DedD